MPKNPALAKRILIKEEYCMGCRICEVHCIAQHSRSKDILKAYTSKTEKLESGIYFEEKGPLSFALQCRHCDDAPCLYACFTGAMYRDKKTDRVPHDEDACIGCWMCIMVCPYGVIKPDIERKKVASKCDLCIEAEFPVCVEHCPNEAIVLIDAEERVITKPDL